MGTCKGLFVTLFAAWSYPETISLTHSLRGRLSVWPFFFSVDALNCSNLLSSCVCQRWLSSGMKYLSKPFMLPWGLLACRATRELASEEAFTSQRNSPFRVLHHKALTCVFAPPPPSPPTVHSSLPHPKAAFIVSFLAWSSMSERADRSAAEQSPAQHLNTAN